MYDLRQNSILTGEYQQVIQNQYGMGLNSVEGAVGGSTGKYSPSIFLLLNFLRFVSP
jgi:hypothetical protein